MACRRRVQSAPWLVCSRPGRRPTTRSPWSPSWPPALAAAAVAALAHRRIGGFTGDTLGAAGVVAETVGLLTAAAVLRP